MASPSDSPPAAMNQTEAEHPRRRLSEPPAPSGNFAPSIMSTRSAKSANTTGSRRSVRILNVARRTLGIGLLMVTVCLWTTSNFLASYIFSDNTYDKPFFLVYVNTSIFAFSLIPLAIKHVIQHGGFTQVPNMVRHAWRNGSHGVRGIKTPADIDVEEDPAAGERLLVDDEGSLEAYDLPRPVEQLSLRETARLSLEFCMIWFLSNYFASACLEYTSVASTTILTSTSSIWTLIFGAIMHIEAFSARKLIAVIASFTGIVLISTVDLSGDNDDGRGNFPHKSQQQIAIGDAMALLSSIVYGIYIVVMKIRVGNEDRVNMPLFFGLVGVFNLAFLWPLFPFLHYTGIEPFEMPPDGKIWLIIMLNSFFSFVSDISWAYAMLLTTPLLVTVGLSLTIPLSLVGEIIQYGQYPSFIYWVGAVVVVLSFVFINNESREDESHEDADRNSNSGSNSGSLPQV
ncbi:hypothetical protein F4810DRAFT_702396 [Camillea tinctor]|nr:hypothetical protein F4810DRAFT_702396 [Camillea tinctor]